ncbi:MAG: isochorismatase family protein [Ferrimicrobium sp.]
MDSIGGIVVDQEVPAGRADDAFFRAGYGQGDIPMGRNIAVLSVDFQLGFTSGELSIGKSEHIQGAVSAATRLLECARDNDRPVFHTFVEYRSDGMDLGLWQWKVPSLASICPGSGWDRIDHRIFGRGDVLIHKKKPSAFFGTGLEALLRESGIDSLVICGVTTSGCVRASVIDAFSFGFPCTVAFDACGDQDAKAHSANLEDMSRRYANVQSVDDICRELFIRSGSVT